MARGRAKPPSQRQLRVGETLRHALAEILERETFQDRALHDVVLTVTQVEASPNLRHATVYITRLGGGDMTDILAGLGRVTSFLRREVSRRVRLQYLPEFRFTADTTFDQVDHIETLLHSPEVARDLENDSHGLPGSEDQDDPDSIRDEHGA